MIIFLNAVLKEMLPLLLLGGYSNTPFFLNHLNIVLFVCCRSENDAVLLYPYNYVLALSISRKLLTVGSMQTNAMAYTTFQHLRNTKHYQNL